MGKTSDKWISIEDFEGIEPDDTLDTRFMNGKAIVKKLNDNGEVTVIFEGGCWDGRELNLIRQQISKVL